MSGPVRACVLSAVEIWGPPRQYRGVFLPAGNLKRLFATKREVGARRVSWTCSAYTMLCLLVDRRPRQRASGRRRPRRPNQTTLTIRWGWPAPGASPSTSSSRTTGLHQLQNPSLPHECSPSKRGLALSSGHRSRWWLQRQSQCRRRPMLRQSWQDQSHGPGLGALRHANRGT